VIRYGDQDAPTEVIRMLVHAIEVGLHGRAQRRARQRPGRRDPHAAPDLAEWPPASAARADFGQVPAQGQGWPQNGLAAVLSQAIQFLSTSPLAVTTDGVALQV
jgi:hypothetical protein